MAFTNTYDGSSCPCCVGGGQTTNCCSGFSTPTTLHITLKNTSNCFCLDGYVITVTYVSPTTWTWIGSGLSNCTSLPISATVTCRSGAGWGVSINCNGNSVTLPPFPDIFCNPFSIIASGIQFAGGLGHPTLCCSGTFSYALTP